MAFDNPPLPPFYTELGAYLFSDSHINLLKASQQFRLPLIRDDTVIPVIHIWNGRKLIVRTLNYLQAES